MLNHRLRRGSLFISIYTPLELPPEDKSLISSHDSLKQDSAWQPVRVLLRHLMPVCSILNGTQCLHGLCRPDRSAPHVFGILLHVQAVIHAYVLNRLFRDSMGMQELEEEALQVMGTREGITRQLQGKEAELAVVRQAYDAKKKEVSFRTHMHAFPAGAHGLSKKSCCKGRA